MGKPRSASSSSRALATSHDSTTVAMREGTVFLPSGLMCNLVAVATHTEPGQLVLLDRAAHVQRV
ncbi:MAG: hypothetical protein EBY49_09615, partial [Actinobacteria bacterium]|nr:hypothetical protein [Actinomycetota bacterium]